MSDTEPLFALGVYNKLGHRTFWLFVSKKSTAAISFFVLALVFTFARGISSLPPEIRSFAGLAGAVCFVIFFIALLIAMLSAWFVYKNDQFCLSNDALKIKHGTFVEKEIAIPYRQIQNVSIERNMSEQMMGLSRIIIATAGHDDEKTPENESEGVLPAIDKHLAEALQEELLRRADVQKVIQTNR